ncbi:MAG: aspartate-semialdehyde dehydrogenase [Desulfuromonas sp.]|nr:aspartate-semialdehyde dehydrogenase [Desulfuromonas sp.]
MYNVAIVGATGVVGRQVIDLLGQRNFPVGSLALYASEKSVGEFLEFNDSSLPVQLLEQDSFKGIDIAFFCAGVAISEQYCSAAAASGVLCIDMSGFFSADATVPLVVPEINPASLQGIKATRIVANPHCASIQLSLLVQALSSVTKMRRVVVSSYQSVSDVGQKGVDELRTQSGELLNGRPSKHKVYPHQMAYNCLPQVGEFLADGYTVVEHQLIDETRQIVGNDSLAISATAVTVPLFYGSCQAVNIATEDELSIERVRELLSNFPAIQVVDDVTNLEYPMPVDVLDQDQLFVGRIRPDSSIDGGLNMWTALDNLRKGCATNAVQIAELLIKAYL